MDITPEFIAEDRTGMRIEIEKVGGGTIGQAYDGRWSYRVTMPASGGFLGSTMTGDDLYTGTPKTHAETAEILCDMVDLEWSDFTPVTGKYVAQFMAPLTSNGNTPEGPCLANTFPSLAAVKDGFRAWLRDSGNDYRFADGYGQPSAWVTLRESWDGFSYGDYPVALFTRGIRGGIVSESV
jgi:hypothetical protein